MQTAVNSSNNNNNENLLLNWMRHDETPQLIQQGCSDILMKLVWVKWSDPKTTETWLPNKETTHGSYFLMELRDLITTLTPTLSNATTAKVKEANQTQWRRRRMAWWNKTKNILLLALIHISLSQACNIQIAHCTHI